MTAPSAPPAGDSAGDRSAERLTWEDTLRCWLIEQDDYLATSSASASRSDAGLLLHGEQVADRKVERPRKRP